MVGRVCMFLRRRSDIRDCFEQDCPMSPDVLEILLSNCHETDITVSTETML